jgi:hypothetical protein
VKTVRYTFPDGETVDAAVQGKYWLMHYWSLQQTPGGSEGGATPGAPARIRVRLLAAEPEQICAQITHGC